MSNGLSETPLACNTCSTIKLKTSTCMNLPSAPTSSPKNHKAAQTIPGPCTHLKGQWASALSKDSQKQTTRSVAWGQGSYDENKSASKESTVLNRFKQNALHTPFFLQQKQSFLTVSALASEPLMNSTSESTRLSGTWRHGGTRQTHSR